MRRAGAFVSAVLLAGCASAPQTVHECAYVSNDREPERSQLSARGDCGELSEGGIALAPEHLAALWFDDDGLGAVYAAQRVFLVAPSGRSVETLVYDNGPDFPSEGLVRAVSGGKVGFVDSSLEFRIPARWDFAFPFSGGYAVVCNGCVSIPVDEHRAMEGGRWGVIDRTGRVVVPVEHTKEGLEAGAAYRALVEPATR